MTARSISVSEVEFSKAPYPGLRPFKADETDIFFGRERQTDELLTRLSEQRFVAIVGPSGCGKSSLVRAGLIPALETGFMAGAGSEWQIAYLRPGGRPIQNLARAIIEARILCEGRMDRSDAGVSVEAVLRRGPLGLVELMEASAVTDKRNLLVLVDQFEELLRFTNGRPSDEAEAFVALLIKSSAARHQRIFVAIAMRTDALAECTAFHGLPEAINEGLYLTPRLNREECEACITNPARVFGGDVEPALVNHLLNDFGPDPDQLPLLQHALMKMWSRRDSERTAGAPITLSVTDYDAVGGLTNALSNHADQAFAELSPEDQRLAEQMFRRLCDPDLGRRDRRSPASVAEIAAWCQVEPSSVIRIANVFRGRGRCFLTPSEETPLAGETILDVSHESLLRQWGKLKAWIQDEAEHVALLRSLKESMLEWQRGEAPLLTPPKLDRALAWRARVRMSAAWASRYVSREDFATLAHFLTESEQAYKRQREDEQRALRLRKYSRRAIIAGSAALLMTLALFITYKIFYVWEHTRYYRTYVKVYGEPRGIGELGKSALRHRMISYEIVTAGRYGHVKRMRAIDNRGKPTGIDADYIDAQHRDREQPKVSSWVYNYSADGVIASEILYSKRGEPVQARVYLPDQKGARSRKAYFLNSQWIPIAVMSPGDREIEGARPSYFWTEIVHYSPSGYEEKIEYRGQEGEVVPGRDGAFAQKKEYDDAGRLVRESSLGMDGAPMNDFYGNSSLVYEYDDDDNVISFTSFDADGHPVRIRDGYAITRSTYDLYGNETSRALFDEDRTPVNGAEGWHLVRWSYDAQGRVIAERYFDSTGIATLDDSGCAARRKEYDREAHLVEVSCRAPDGAPAINRYGYATSQMTYDSKDRITRIGYLDVVGRPALHKDGYGSVRTEYDGLGRIARVSYHDEMGRLTANRKGYAVKVVECDEQRRSRSTTFLDSVEMPVLGEDGYSIVIRTVDEFSNTIEERYFDARKVPIMLAEGYAAKRFSYDSSGRMIAEVYLGTNGETVFGKNGYTGWRLGDFDSLGRGTLLTYTGLRGEPIASTPRGVVSVRFKYDQWGREIEHKYLGEDGEPIAQVEGEAGWLAEYDALGRQTKISYFDTKGELTLTSWDGKQFYGAGYARKVQRYDARGLVTEVEYYGVRGERVLHPDGWWRKVYGYDALGNLVRMSYFDASEAKVSLTKALDAGGYHRVEWKRDARGDASELAYFDTADRPVESDDGYARAEVKHDRFGNRTEWAVYGADGRPVATREGMHRLRIERDDRGRVIREQRFGPAEPSKVLGATEYEYDAAAIEPKEERHYGESHQLVTSKSQPCAILATIRDRNDIQEIRCLSAAREPLPGLALDGDDQGGCARIVYTWERPGIWIAKSCYDKDGKLFAHPAQGYAEIRYKKDMIGRVIETSYLDARGRNVRGDGGYSTLRNAYDTFGNVIKRETFLPSGEPTSPIAAVVSKFDDRHRLCEERYFGPNMSPVKLWGVGQHVTRYEYDALNQVSIIDFLGVDDKPTYGYPVGYTNNLQPCAWWQVTDLKHKQGICAQDFLERVSPKETPQASL